MLWAHLLAEVSGTVNQELLLRNEYLAAENWTLRGQIRASLLLSDGENQHPAPLGTEPATEPSLMMPGISISFFFSEQRSFICCATPL
jgi:hypothetical protein